MFFLCSMVLVEDTLREAYAAGWSMSKDVDRRESQRSTRAGGKVCGVCEKEKPYSEFNRRSSSKDGHSYRCRECEKRARAIKKMEE